MNRRTFLSRLLVGLMAAPVVAKVIREPKPLVYFRGDEYLRQAPFTLDGPQTVYFLPGVSGNYASVPYWPPAEIRDDSSIVILPARPC